MSAGTHPPFRLQGKVAIVTGSSSGLGRAIGLAYASHGAKLIVCADLSPEPRAGVDDETEPTHKLINRVYGGGRAVFVRTDVADAENVEALVAEAVRVGGRLDIMVNNAGVGTPSGIKRLHEEEDADWDKVIRVNLRGVYLGSKHALRQFMKQDLNAQGRRGWIVNVASMLGFVAIAGGTGAYCASKAGCLNLTRQIAIDYAKDRIHANALCPGFTKTAMTQPNYTNADVDKAMRDTTPWGEWGTPQDVAKAAVFLASDDAAWVTGIGLPVDGGYLAQ